MNIIATALGDTARLVDAIAANDARRCLQLNSYWYRCQLYLVFEQEDGSWKAGPQGEWSADGATELDAMCARTVERVGASGALGGTRAEVAAAMEATR